MIYDSALGLGLRHGVSSPAFGPDGVLVDSDQGPSGGGLPAFRPDGVCVCECVCVCVCLVSPSPRIAG